MGKPSSEREVVIVAMGDSLSAGYGVDPEDAYPAVLERKLRTAGYNCRVINAGINGEKSAEALERLPIVISVRPDIVIVQTGTNDGLRGLPPDQLKRNLSEIIRTFSEKGIAVIVAGMRNLKSRKGDYDKLFAEVYAEVAKELGVALIPFFLEGVAWNGDLNRPDGIHPTAEGYRVVVATVFPYVTGAIGSLK